ncbi:MAG: hypothetical protein JJU07_15040 [Natronohydrobacter sp.]|nr:hypothetical protein [Natronohydrobacter sp.]
MQVFLMAGKPRYRKKTDGRFYARIAVPVLLRPFLDEPRSELIAPLGADRRAALRQHPAVVARLQEHLAMAAKYATGPRSSDIGL